MPKTIAVLGTGPGMSRSVANRFGREGFRVALVARNRAKLESLVDNAQTMLELDAEHKGFRRYLHSLGGYDETVSDLKGQFRFVGDTGAYYFLHVVGEEVPSHDEWSSRRRSRAR